MKQPNKYRVDWENTTYRKYKNNTIQQVFFSLTLDRNLRPPGESQYWSKVPAEDPDRRSYFNFIHPSGHPPGTSKASSGGPRYTSSGGSPCSSPSFLTFFFALLLLGFRGSSFLSRPCPLGVFASFSCNSGGSCAFNSCSRIWLGLEEVFFGLILFLAAKK